MLGHSLGGMVAWHALATRPTLFRGYLIVDGSVFWNHGQVVDEVERALKSATPPPARVFWVRDAIPHEVWFPENHRLKALVDAPPSPVTHITFHEEPNETHGTVVYPGTYLGLKGLFADYRAVARPDWTVAEMDAYYAALSRTYGFDVVVPRAMMAMVGEGSPSRGTPQRQSWPGDATWRRIRNPSRPSTIWRRACSSTGRLPRHSVPGRKRWRSPSALAQPTWTNDVTLWRGRLDRRERARPCGHASLSASLRAA